LAPFTALTALTKLDVGPVSPAAIRSDLAALTQLHRLQFSVSQPAAGPDGGAAAGLHDLAPLTALTGLTYLCNWDTKVELRNRVSGAGGGDSTLCWCSATSRAVLCS
jgi:hypothetical protein